MSFPIRTTAISLFAAAWLTASPASANGNGVQECDHLSPCPPPGGDTTTIINNDPTAISGAHATGVGHVNTDVRANTDVGVVTNVEGDGPITQNGGDQRVTVQGDRHNTRVGAITGAPTVFGPSNLSACSSGWALSVGGGNPFTGSGGLGFSYTSPSGAPVLVSADEFLQMPLEERQRVVAEAGLTDTELSRLQCGLNAAYARDQAHAHRLAELGVRTLLESDEEWKEAAAYATIAVEHDGFKRGVRAVFGSKNDLMDQGVTNPTAAQLLEGAIMNMD